MKFSGIYKIENLINNKIYIGASSNIIKRIIKEHIGLLKNNKHDNPHLQNSWNKYLPVNWEFSVIEEVGNITLLKEREQYWLDFFKSYNVDVGYNISKVSFGSPMTGRKHSENTIRIMSEKKTGVNHPMYNKKHNETARKNMSISKIGNKYSLGRKLTDEHKRKISIANMEKNVSDFTLDKMINSKRNKMKKIERINILTGEVKEYDSVHLASRDGFGLGNICHCLGGRRNSHKGFYWKYLE